MFFLSVIFTSNQQNYLKDQKMEFQDILLKSKKSKYAKSLISSLMFMSLCIKFMIMHDSLLWLPLIILFALSSLASAICLIPNQSYIRLDNAGLTIRSMFKTINICWNELEGFYTDRKYSKTIVAFSYKQKKYNHLNIENLVKANEVLPDSYGLNAADLAALLEKYRIRFSRFQNN